MHCKGLFVRFGGRFRSASLSHPSTKWSTGTFHRDTAYLWCVLCCFKYANEREEAWWLYWV